MGASLGSAILPAGTGPAHLQDTAIATGLEEGSSTHGSSSSIAPRLLLQAWSVVGPLDLEVEADIAARTA